MTAKANVKDIQWSRQQYTLREAIKRCTFPQIMKVVEGYESSDETETLARDQILRIHQIHTQTRVLATTDKKGRWLSIPLRYAEARFEVVSSGKRSKAMYMREIIDKSLLPQKVNFFTGDDLTFHLQLKSNVPNAKEKFGALTLQKMYETGYLQGNAIQNDHLDTMILNIPLHSPVSVVLAESFIVGSRDRWERYQTLLDKIVSKNVVFELHPGNPHITFFTDKGLETASQQEQYEKITPSGTLFITTKNERLKQNQGSVLAGPSGAKTLSAVSAGKAANKDRDNASVQVGERQGRPILRHVQSDMTGGSTIMADRPRMQSPGRPLTHQFKSVHGTMPKSIMKKRVPADDRFPPPPAELITGNSIFNPMAYMRDSRQQSPPPKQGVHRSTTHSAGHLDARAKSPIRVDYPRPANTNSSPRGSGSSMNSLAESGYSTSSSNDPRSRPPGSNQFQGKLPDPDYDADHGMTNGRGGDDNDYSSSMKYSHQPPAPPPIATIPSKQNVPNGVPAAPPAQAVPGAPPPPPIGFIPPPPPPQYREVAQIKANQTPKQSPASKPQMNTGNARDDMMQEIKMKAERRASRLEGIIPSNKPPSFGNKSSPRTNNNNSSPRPLNNNNDPGNELQARLAKRYSLADGAGLDKNTFNKTPPPPAAKPSQRQTNSKTPPVASKFGGGGGVGNSAKADGVTFDSLEAIPKDLSALSVSQVCQALKLMNLEKYCPAFKSNSVDGQLMKQLNKEALVDSFKLSGWDAQRVETFIKGWRPKY